MRSKRWSGCRTLKNHSHRNDVFAALKEKYHYYIIGFALPEDCALLGCGVYLIMTNASALARIGVSAFGVSPADGGRRVCDGLAARLVLYLVAAQQVLEVLTSSGTIPCSKSSI